MAHRAPPRYRSSQLVSRLWATVAYTYDRADQAIQQTISGVDTAFAYNAWGDLTAAADRDHGATTHAYDAGGRMVSLTPPGATPATFTYDALGRPAVRSIASASLTYAYIGSGNVSYATIPNAGSATYALIDADASRLALDTGGTTAWSLFDLHGDLAATTAAAGATIVSALRSDAYGATLDAYTAGSGATAVPWRYQGRLDLSPDPNEPLYDAGARRYRPSLGAFTALDTYPGSALNPLSLNRYLYAHANPTSLIDPTGHCVTCPPMLDGAYTLPTQGANAPVSAAAAQAQVADAASWAPAGSTNTTNTADAMARAAQQAKANKHQAGEIQRFRTFTLRMPTAGPANSGFDPGDTGGFFVGVGEGAWALGASVVDIGAWGWRTASDEQQRALNGLVWDYTVNHPGEAAGAMWSGLVDPIVDDWRSGNQGEAIGRAAFDIGSAVVPLAKLATARHAGRLGGVGRASTALAPSRYPPNLGFLGRPLRTTLEPGTVIERYGVDRGRFASPVGTAFEARSLPPEAAAFRPSQFEVLSPISVDQGLVAPWFGQPGLGIQYHFDALISDLIKAGALRRLD